jgi:uncharacterized membrane protein YkoI
LRALYLFAGLTLTAQVVAAQSEVKVKEESPGLLKQAKVTADSALKVALARVPNGKMKSGEIEREDGRLVYSFDLVVTGKKGIEEVQVDALTGRVVSVELETPEQEAEEAKAQKPSSKP